MSEPKRLLLDGTSLERRLLGSATSDNPAPQRRLAALAIAAATYEIKVASASTGVATGALAVKASLSALLAVGALGAAKLAANKLHEGGAMRATTSIVGASSTRGEKAHPSVAPPAPVVELGPEQAPLAPTPPIELLGPPRPSPPAHSSDSGGRRVLAPAPAPADLTLACELSAVDRARSAMKASDAIQALFALDEQRSKCSTHAFELEASVLRAEALLLSGRIDEARAIATRVRESAAAAGYGARIARVLGSAVTADAGRIDK